MRCIFTKWAGLQIFALLFVTGLTHADGDHDAARELREAGDILPLETILQKIRQTHPGKVLEVELEKEHGQLVYVIELLDANGKLWELEVNPHTGALLEQQEDN